MKEDLKQKYQLPEVASFKPSNLSPCSKWHPPPQQKKTYAASRKSQRSEVGVGPAPSKAGALAQETVHGE